MLLSVVVISWNSRAMLERCLEVLSDAIAPYGTDAEVIWVDNGSTDGAKEFVAEKYPTVKRIILDRNYGVAAARNRGVSAAQGKYVFFVDDDAEPERKAVSTMIEYMERHPQTGICAVSLHDADGNLQQSFKEYPGLGVKVRNVVRSFTGGDAKPQLPEGVIHPCYVIGACQMIRRELFKSIGLLDEHIFYGPEDADFCIRVTEAGYTVDYIPYASMLHHWRHISRRNIFSRTSRLHIAALLHFYRKHHRWI